METNRNTDEEQTGYELEEILPEETLHVPPGTNILIAGPPMSGKRELALSILAQGATNGEGNVIVSTDRGADTITKDFTKLVPNLDRKSLGIVESRESGGSAKDEFVHSVASPGDLTGIGIGISQFMQRFSQNGITRTRLALDSVSTLLSYVEVRTVFKFCHVLTARLEAVGYLGVFTLDTGAHDAQAINTIKQVFDGMIELRESDTGIEMRVVGLGGKRTKWAAYEPNHS
ncbi:RAD55 family ATPase [Haladaptatus sp. DJG-WS-42]|uniref:RAD55 family ATPase n=1 Tax=Haladaptatus sp. DJG-WS-42 TaxID=3120516 RepID=UPI0030CC4288